LILTEDFKKFERKGVLVPPEDKDGCLFPKKFKDGYALIHRPIIRGEGHIWISFSHDLTYWGKHQILLPARPGMWDCHRVGLGAPPIETKEGWLIIFAGFPVDNRVAMTGELSIRGLVKPVGGIAAKVEAARQAGAKKVIIPAENYQQLFLGYDGLEVIPVEHLEEVLEVALIAPHWSEKPVLPANLASDPLERVYAKGPGL